MTKEVQKWADEAMFTAEESVPEPRAYLLQATPDPLGSIASLSAMYTGKVVRDKGEITNEERRFHLEQMRQTKLKAPLEAVNFHFMIEGVTRSFTHQMVRQRTAVYAQESLRFAVKEDAASAIALPPSLAGTTGLADWLKENGLTDDYDVDFYDEFHRESTLQQMRLLWDADNERVSELYNRLVNMGMPAEDARGRLPHAITTRLNYATNLRNLQDHAGNRLCTQAQFEWRTVWMHMINAMKEYCTLPRHQEMPRNHAGLLAAHEGNVWCDNWQFVEIAGLFRPVCYLTGKCEFKADFDRKCKIRSRVDANASIGRSSSEWGTSANVDPMADGVPIDGGRVHEDPQTGQPIFIGAISPAEWLLDDGAAR